MTGTIEGVDMLTEPSFTSSCDSDGLLRMVVAGEIDMATSEALGAALREATGTDGTKEVAVEMSGVTFIDSSGIRTLVIAQGEASELGVTLYVTEPHHHVRRILELTGLLTVLTEPTPPATGE